MNQDFLDSIQWNSDGLVPAIAQDAVSGRVLMMAWMNRESLAQTVDTGTAVYWSRSRGALWKKGETSGHTQAVRDIQIDCDGDTLLLTVQQRGGIACHTGRESCFYRGLEGGQWREREPVLREPDDIYGSTP